MRDGARGALHSLCVGAALGREQRQGALALINGTACTFGVAITLAMAIGAPRGRYRSSCRGRHERSVAWPGSGPVRAATIVQHAMHSVAHKLLNVLILVALIGLNGLAATGTLSGVSIGELANRPGSISLFLPANYVFGIWSLIYLGLTAFTVRQALPGSAATRAGETIGIWWLITSVLNVAWITTFSFERYGLAMLVMLSLLVALIIVAGRLAPTAARGTWVDRICVAWPFHVYLAWISVAIIANTFQYAHVVGWAGFGIAESTWSVAMMVVATALGWGMATRGIWVFPIVVAWALRGIGVRWPAVAPVHEAAAVLVPLGLVGGALLTVRDILASRRRAVREA